MSRFSTMPRWAGVLLIGFAAAFTAAYLAAMQNGVSHGVAVRTYVFWALVCAPVAVLAEMLVRSAREYRAVRVLTERLATIRTRG